MRGSRFFSSRLYDANRSCIIIAAPARKRRRQLLMLRRGATVRGFSRLRTRKKLDGFELDKVTANKFVNEVSCQLRNCRGVSAVECCSPLSARGLAQRRLVYPTTHWYHHSDNIISLHAPARSFSSSCDPPMGTVKELVSDQFKRACRFNIYF